MCHRTKKRRIHELYSAMHPLVHRHSGRRVRLLQTSRPEIEKRCSGAVQSFETRLCRSGFESQGSSCATRFHRTSQGHRRARRARPAFPRLRKQPAVSPVPAGAISPEHDRCRHLLKERLQLECCVANLGVAATAACFRFAGRNQARRLSGTSGENLRSRR